MNDDGSPPIDRARAAWWVVLLGTIAVVGYVLLSFVGTFLLGLFVYYVTRPVYVRVRQGLPSPNLAAAVSLLAIALPALGVLGYTVMLALQELDDLTGDLDEYQELLQPYVDMTALTEALRGPLEEALVEPSALVGAGGLETVQDVLGVVLAYLGIVANGLIHLFVVLAVAFYLLRDDRRLGHWFAAQFEGETTRRFATAVDRDLETIYFGNILTAFVVAVVAAVVYTLLDLIAPPGLGVPVPALLGMLTGIASLIPVVGMKLIYVPVGLYLTVLAAADGTELLWFPVAFLLAAFAFVDSLLEVALRPYVSGRDLHVGLVMIAYVVGPLLFGWYGLFLAPLILVVVVHVGRVVLPVLVGEGPPPSDHETGNPLVKSDANEATGIGAAVVGAVGGIGSSAGEGGSSAGESGSSAGDVDSPVGEARAADDPAAERDAADGTDADGESGADAGSGGNDDPPV